MKIKRLIFTSHNREICTKCGKISISSIPSNNSSDTYVNECSECYQPKKFRMQVTRAKQFKHYLEA